MYNQFLYHSFPRRGRDNNDLAITRGLAILSSIIKSGLLLTPEVTYWCEHLQDGTLSQPVKLFQKRICFTLLSPSRLQEHATTFGPFAFEYSVEKLRSLGGVPVFYLPYARETDMGFEGIGGALMARLSEIQKLLTRLFELDDLIQRTQNKNELLNITHNRIEVAQTRCTAGAAADLINFLTYGMQPPSQLLNAIRGLSGFFYPTEDQNFTRILDYYHQREWRIIGNMIKKGKESTRSLRESEIEKLKEIDNEFFGHKLDFPTGVHNRAEQSLIFHEVANKHVLHFARRLIVPEKALEKASQIIGDFNKNLEVVSLESLKKKDLIG